MLSLKGQARRTESGLQAHPPHFHRFSKTVIPPVSRSHPFSLSHYFPAEYAIVFRITIWSDRNHIGRPSPGSNMKCDPCEQAHRGCIMRLAGAVKHSRSGEKLNIVAVEADEQRRRIHEAVARRAFEIFEKRGTGSHQQEDWRQAESALLRPICIGRMAIDDSFWVSADATNFQEGTINIWVAPRLLTICGMPRPKQQATTLIPGSSARQEEVMFREVRLPIEIDPSNVTACVNGKFLEIRLKKAQPTPAQATRAAAA